MSNLGYMTIYQHVNMRADSLCHRGFLPNYKDKKMFEKTRTPLFSMESQVPLKEL